MLRTIRPTGRSFASLRMTMSDLAFFRIFARFALSRLLRFFWMVLDMHVLHRRSGDIHVPPSVPSPGAVPGMDAL